MPRIPGVRTLKFELGLYGTTLAHYIALVTLNSQLRVSGPNPAGQNIVIEATDSVQTQTNILHSATCWQCWTSVTAFAPYSNFILISILSAVMANMRPSLNEDVLDQIFQFCSKSTLAVLCQVSSDTRSIGWRHMCRTVTLPHSHRRLREFLKFIVDNTHNTETGRIWGAGTHVLRLKLREDDSDPMGLFDDPGDERCLASKWAPHLAHALTLMPQLLSFSLKDGAEEIASHSPQFGIALSNHPSLTYLELRPIGPLLSNQLERAADSAHNFSKLRGIEFSLNPGQQDQAMWRFLFLYRDRLTKVVSSNWDLSFLIHNGNLHPDHNAAMVFSNVVHLQLESCSFSIQAIATLFPAVKTLSIPNLRLVSQPNSHVHFANLVSVQGDWNIIVILLTRTNNSYIRRLAVSQRELDWSEGPSAQLPDSDPRVFCGVPAASSLRSLKFEQPWIRSLSWWTTFSRTIPCLVVLEMELGVNIRSLHLLVRVMVHFSKLEDPLNLNLNIFSAKIFLVSCHPRRLCASLSTSTFITI